MRSFSYGLVGGFYFFFDVFVIAVSFVFGELSAFASVEYTIPLGAIRGSIDFSGLDFIAFMCVSRNEFDMRCMVCCHCSSFQLFSSIFT